MPDIIAFRAGRTLLRGTLRETRGSVHRVEMPEGDVVEVDDRFRLRAPAMLHEVTQRSLFTALTDSIIPALLAGQKLRTESVWLRGLDRTNNGPRLRLREGNRDLSASLFSVLSEHAQLGEHMALDAHRPMLTRLGFIEGEGSPLIDGDGVLTRPVNVYLKRDLFRDVGRIHEGTSVSVMGYFRGCAVVEADGEECWLPVEHNYFIESLVKDPDYYFNLDADGNLVPDPLDFLPSKSGLAMKPGDTSADDNWNAQPELTHVSGHFAPLPQLGDPMHDFLHGKKGSIGESYAPLFYHHDYQHAYPELHGLGGRAVHHRDFSSQEHDDADVEQLVKGAPLGVRPGRPAVECMKHDFSPQEQGAMDLASLSSGAPLGSVFDRAPSMDNFAEVFREMYERIVGMPPTEAVVRACYADASRRHDCG